MLAAFSFIFFVVFGLGALNNFFESRRAYKDILSFRFYKPWFNEPLQKAKARFIGNITGFILTGSLAIVFMISFIYQIYLTIKN